MENNKQPNEDMINHFKEFKEYFENQEEEINPTFQKSTIMSLEKFQEMILGEKESELTALDKKLDQTLGEKHGGLSSKLLSFNKLQDPKLENSLKKMGLLSEKKEDVLIVRKMPIIIQEQFDQIEKEYIFKDNKNILFDLYEYLKKVNCNFRNPSCYNSVGGINPLTYIIEKSFHMSNKMINQMKEKYNLLNKYMVNYREINTDGNCYYRAVIFRYIEILILTNNIPVFQRLIYEVIESFKSVEIQKRRIINKSDIKPDLTFRILFLILNILKQNKIKEAHQLFVKCVSTCKKFDYCLILYFRYVLYKYIKQNENKLYTKDFPLKIGNLLPQQYENEKGEFLFDSFYENYLLKFFTDAEKIVIYLTPFVLGIEINVIVFDIVDEEVIQKFLWEGESDIKTKEVISLLNSKNHYSLVYTEYDNKKYKKIFEFYYSNIKSVIMKKSIAPNAINYELDDIQSYTEIINKDNNLGNNKDVNNFKNNEDINKDINQNKNDNKKNVNNNKENNVVNKIEQYNNKNNNIITNIDKNNSNFNKKQNSNNNKNEIKPESGTTNIENIKNENNITNINHENKNKKAYINKDNNEIMISTINLKRNNIDNNVEYVERKNQNNNNQNNVQKEIKNESPKQKQIKMNEAKHNNVIKDKSKEKISKKAEENKNLVNNEIDEKGEKMKASNKDVKNNKEKKVHKSQSCKNCKDNMKINEENPYCKNCFKTELIKQYYDCIQSGKEPIENIYLLINRKKYYLEKLIKIYNESYDDSKFDYQKFLLNYKNNKCIFCSIKNNIPLPCECVNCHYCSHLNTYFEVCDLKTRFICPGKVQYDRKQMFKLAILLYKFENGKKEIKGIIKYFDRRLTKNCCICNENLTEEKKFLNVYDSQKQEEVNKLLSKIKHYLCEDCFKNKKQKDFNCKICHVEHII